MPSHAQYAPGAPGISARWTSSAKSAVGTALSDESRVWFTLSHGIFNEIYYPRIDQACVRDMGLIITDGADFFSEEKRDADSTLNWLADGVPAFRLVNTCRAGRYRIEKQVVSDPRRDTVLQLARFVPLQGALSSYRLYVLCAPHLGNQGAGNDAWVEDFEGTPLLFAQRNGNALALACDAPWTQRSVGYVGFSDGWRDIKAHQRMTSAYTRAENGNVALTAGVDLVECGGEFVLALGFGKDPEAAARNAIASLREGFAKALADYVAGWQDFMRDHSTLHERESAPGDLSRTSLAVLRSHESKATPGGVIASLSIPWGFSKGDNDLGGYHLVWARDMVEAAGGYLAAGAHAEARSALFYLRRTQTADGHWPQNMWLDGSPYWNGIQMDETALPILLVELAYRENALSKADLADFWPMVRSAASYLVRNGPASPEDRWEEDPGYSPFTVAAEIAALLAAAALAELHAEAGVADYLRETADIWNAGIDRWMYVSNTDWSERFGVKGYYVRIAPMENGAQVSRFERVVHLKNVAVGADDRAAGHLVSPDALALVRFGLRAADDSRIRDSVTVIDALLKTETPAGAVWHRYNGDGYGEHEHGEPFDGTGIGRGWPLLAGERAHYELSAGRIESARQCLKALESFANDGGLIPEQVWDAPDLPERELYRGRASGSAMPLVWAHAEYLKLKRSLHDGRVFDLPPQTVRRYLVDKTGSSRVLWRFNHKIRWLPLGKVLRIETLARAVVRWSRDDWKTIEDAASHDRGLGTHSVDLETSSLAEGASIQFTFYWPDADRWEGANFCVRVGPR